MKIKGFTLAEILITLAIIGVVATLTIPGTIKNYRNKVLTTQLQNTINLVASAVSQAMDDNAAEKFDSIFTSEQSFENFLEKYFDTVNICNYSSRNNCLAEMYTSFDNSASLYSGDALDIIDKSSARCAVTTSGATICFNGTEFLIDVNGQESPNVNGKDFFYFWVKDNGKLSYSYPEKLAIQTSNEIKDLQAGSDEAAAAQEYLALMNRFMKENASGVSCVVNKVNPTETNCLSYIISHGWTFKF